MPEAVLWDIKFGRRTTKILIDEFFDIPLLLAKKKFFSTPLVGAALLGGGGNLHFGGLVTLDKNETFHSLCLCYPATFGEKKKFRLPLFFAKSCRIA